MPVIELNNVVKSYTHPTGDIAVLKGVNLVVEQGESIAIVGQSGSGKSTLLSLLAGLDRPSQGEIKLLGHDLSSYSGDKLVSFRARHLGIVFQQFHLMPHLTAKENVELPLRIAGRKNFRELAKAALTDVGLAHRSEHLPRELSGGESQRVAIARAMVHHPEILLADEPSGNLDAQTGDKVMSLLFDVAKEHRMTLVLVTHNQNLATACSRQMLLERGQFTHALT